jgi:hypothetical protein
MEINYCLFTLLRDNGAKAVQYCRLYLDFAYFSLLHKCDLQVWHSCTFVSTNMGPDKKYRYSPPSDLNIQTRRHAFVI